MMLRNMLPPPECNGDVHCGGRGWYPTDPEGPHEGREVFCTCDAGRIRGEYDDGGDIEEITLRLRGRSREAEWARYVYNEESRTWSLR